MHVGSCWVARSRSSIHGNMRVHTREGVAQDHACAWKAMRQEPDGWSRFGVLGKRALHGLQLPVLHHIYECIQHREREIERERDMREIERWRESERNKNKKRRQRQ